METKFYFKISVALFSNLLEIVNECCTNFKLKFLKVKLVYSYMKKIYLMLKNIASVLYKSNIFLKLNI